MRDDGYRSILAAVMLSHQEAKDRTRCTELVDHMKELYSSSSIKHQQLLSDSMNYQVFVLVVAAQQSTHENIVLYIYDDESCRQHTINQGETYRFELGQHVNYRLKFAVARFNGEKRKAVVRSSSFIKRFAWVMSLDKRDGDSVQLSSLPLQVTQRKCIAHKGHCYTTDITLMRETRSELVPSLTFEDLLDLTRTVHEWEALSMDGDYDGELSDSSFGLLHTATTFHEVAPVVLKIATLSVFLVWDYSLRGLDDSAIPRLVHQIRQQENIDTEDALLAQSLSHLSQCVQGELEDVLSRFDRESLFPPEGHLPLKKMNLALKSVVDICVLSVWDGNASADPSVVLSSLLGKMLRQSATHWVTEQFNPDAEDIKETCLMVQTMWDLVQHNYQSSNLFFHQFNINYVQVTLSTIDERLESSSQAYLSSRLASLDSRSPEQLELFSKCTMRFYETIASISKFAMQHRVKNLRLHGYESWFLRVTVFWTYSWRTLSLRMVERTISLDDDGDTAKTELRRPLPAGLYSFLCIQKGLSDDYCMLSFTNPENIMMSTMALVHIYCENVCAYGKKLFCEATSQEADEVSHLIRAANGIEQSLEYIDERWRKFLMWDDQMKYLEDAEADSIEAAAEAVLQSTRQRCSELIHSMVRRYCSSRREDVSRIAGSITLDSTEYTNTFKSYMRDITPLERQNATLRVVDELADDLRRLFLPKCFEASIDCAFDILENEVEHQMKQAQPPEYYGSIYVTVKSVVELLEITPSRSKLSKSLHYRSFSTEELILSFFCQLSDMVERRGRGDGPSISIQIGHLRQDDGHILIVGKVLELSNFPSGNPLCDRMDPYVRLELLPRILFPEKTYPALKTKTVPHCDRPCWKQDFQFQVPQSVFFTNGASLCVTVLDKDRICDQLLGRSFVSLGRVPQCSSPCRLPGARDLSLIQPGIGHSLPFYKMLKERSRYDRTARQFVLREVSARQMVAHVRRLSTKMARKNMCI